MIIFEMDICQELITIVIQFGDILHIRYTIVHGRHFDYASKGGMTSKRHAGLDPASRSGRGPLAAHATLGAPLFLSYFSFLKD